MPDLIKLKSKPKSKKPEYVLKMEAAYGAPSQDGFGSAVFFEKLGPDDSLETAALQKYQYYVGDLWERWGEDAWMGPWKEVYVREAKLKHDIVAELQSISDRDVASSVPMILSVVKDADSAKLALSNAYDDEDVEELSVYNLGDGEAMSGLIVAGRRSNNEATFLVFLMD